MRTGGVGDGTAPGSVLLADIGAAGKVQPVGAPSPADAYRFRKDGQPAPVELVEGAAPVLLLCDHASNAVPGDIDLAIPPEASTRHIAIDIGAAPLTRALAAALGAPAVLATLSRLVIDLHREPDHPGLVPEWSDGQPVPGNIGVDRGARIARFHAPYHRAVADQIRIRRPALLMAIHSFTPQLEECAAEPRRWQVGVLSNRDRRAAEPALAFLHAEGLIVGDNEPYSGRMLNATLNRHGEANGIPSLSIEVRNDLIGDPAGVEHWCTILARLARSLLEAVKR